MQIRQSWNKLTSGIFGYVVYAVLGIVAAYLFYFGIGFVLHTDLPFVAVVSGSMDHGINEDGPPCGSAVNYTETFDNWWAQCGSYYVDLGITEVQFKTFPFSNGFKIGDMPIVEGDTSYKVGDIIVYSVPSEPAPIIHRIVKINLDGTLQTRGDHNSGQNPYEYSVKLSQIHGKVIFILPKIAYLKVILNRLFGV